MTDKPTCRKCSGSGEFANGGPCFACNGTGKVGEMAYTTVSAKASSNPALVAERNLKPAKPYLVNHEHALREIAKAKQAAAYEPDKKEKKRLVSQVRCVHEWSRTDQCEKCDIFLVQIMYSVNTPMVSDRANGVFQ